MMKNLPAVLIAIWMSLVVLPCSSAQEIRLDGEVIDENGDPVVGATVTGFYLALDVFGANGKLIESLHANQLLDDENRISREKVEGFLSSHVIKPLDAKVVLAEGLAIAKQENKRILVQYSSSFRQECDQLTQFLDRNRIWEKDYLWLRIDTRWDQAAAVLDDINERQVLDIPWFAILDADGNKLTDSETDPRPNSESLERTNIGFPLKSFEKNHFKKMLMDTRIRLSEGEIDELILALDRD